MNITLLVSNIQKLCNERGTTVNQMLQECNLHKSTIDHMKKENPSIPSIDKIFTIAEYFNVSVDYLLGYTPKVDDEEQEYIKFFASLSPAERLLAYKIAATSIGTIRKNLAESKEGK